MGLKFTALFDWEIPSWTNLVGQLAVIQLGFLYVRHKDTSIMIEEFLLNLPRWKKGLLAMAAVQPYGFWGIVGCL